MKNVIKYEHHGKLVSVIEELRGTHRDNCLCYIDCEFFKPGEDDHCEIAQANFEMCIKFNLVTPVVECAKYNKETQNE